MSLIYNHPEFEYNKDGILVPKVNPEYPTPEIASKVEERNDSATVEEANKTNNKKNRKRRKKYKIKK